MTTYQLADQEVHDGYLLDIAFEMSQAGEFKKIFQKHLFTKQRSKELKESITLCHENKRRLMDDYQKRYGIQPDIALAKRLFLNNKEAS